MNNYGKNTKEDEMIFGRHPVTEALEAGRVLDKIFLQQGMRGEFEKMIRKLSKQLDVPIQYVPVQKLNRLCKHNHQGIVGLTPAVRYQELDNILPHLFEQGSNPLILLLDGVTDVRNVGAIARSAEIFGCHAIVVPQKGGAWINGVAVKASAGALHRIAVCRELDMQIAIDKLRTYGVQIFASDLKGDKEISAIDFKEPSALVIGSEGSGVSPKILDIVDHRFFIPQLGETDSLNVSVASGVMMYEVMQQRKNSRGKAGS